ncbi:hypothetical protein KFL_010770040 [Klebsormidium nitens]|uniref:Uncharacterized protein n=1 Tax=Klebsormidium nitens TaxID=105231 RepID=A0A1Y1ITH0_KLENI|nr:hypothetical protein KFL_010770040 [Klebsormidium nitens]|eukprot:GAQ92631.1 hypothetical protein KFL_010770040 [Klebsormidium nitens]
MAGAHAADLDLLLMSTLIETLVHAGLTKEELRHYLPAARDDIVKAHQKGRIAVFDPATRRLKRAEEIFPAGVSNNLSLQCVAVGLYNGVNVYICIDALTNKRCRKIKWSDLFPRVTRSQSLGQKGLWEALDFLLSLIAANRTLCLTVKAYLDGYFVEAGTAACNTATRARLEACFAHMLAAFPTPAANPVPNMVSNDDTMASPDALAFDPLFICNLPNIEDVDEADFADLLRAFGAEAAQDQA